MRDQDSSLLFFLFLKVRVAMQFTTETREYLTCEILPLSFMKGWVLSEIKFLECIDKKIFLPMVFPFGHLKRERGADNNASHRYREVTGSNPVEVPNFFQASLRNCINCVHCDDHFFIFNDNINNSNNNSNYSNN